MDGSADSEEEYHKKERQMNETHVSKEHSPCIGTTRPMPQPRAVGNGRQVTQDRCASLKRLGADNPIFFWFLFAVFRFFAKRLLTSRLPAPRVVQLRTPAGIPDAC